MVALNKNVISLGSAQFGINYGITNTKGKVELTEATKIIKKAIDNGIEYIDTAAAYGNSEQVIGKALSDCFGHKVKIITKPFPFVDYNSKLSDKVYLKSLLRNSVLKSYSNLNVKKIDTIMLHRAQHLKYQFIIDELIKLKNEKLFNNIGVSVQNPEELDLALRADYISAIQLPLNILDHRWDEFFYNIKKIKEKKKLIIHARSIFLQGLLIDNTSSNWHKANISEFKKVKSWIIKMIKDLNRTSIKDLCINYVKGLNCVDSLVIGVENLEQLNENFFLNNNKPLDMIEINHIKKTRPILDISSLDPSMWKRK